MAVGIIKDVSYSPRYEDLDAQCGPVEVIILRMAVETGQFRTGTQVTDESKY